MEAGQPQVPDLDALPVWLELSEEEGRAEEGVGARGTLLLKARFYHPLAQAPRSLPGGVPPLHPLTLLICPLRLKEIRIKKRQWNCRQDY